MKQKEKEKLCKQLREEKNMTWREIGKELGMSYQGARQLYMRACLPSLKKTKWSKHRAEMKKLYDEGMGVSPIARKFGASYHVVEGQLKKAGIIFEKENQNT